MAHVIQITGIDKVIDKLRKAGVDIEARIGNALKEGGNFLLRESQKLVPIQTGNLKGGARCRNVGGGGSKTDIVVEYLADYAVYVHEDLNKAHGRAFNIKHAKEIAAAGVMGKSKAGRNIWKPTSKAGTAQGGMFPRRDDEQAKFLERPAREKRNEIFSVIAEEAKRI